MLQNTFLHQPTTINLPGLRPYRPEALTQQPSGASPLQAGGPHPAEALYFERGDYPPDQRLILQAESFFADPAQSLAAVCAFLGLPAHDFAPPRVDNPTGRGKERPEHFDALKAAFAERGELRAKSRERRAESGGQRAEGRERRAEGVHPGARPFQITVAPVESSGKIRYAPRIPRGEPAP